MVASRLGVVVLGTCLLLACSKETPPAAEEPRSASNAATPQSPPNAADGTKAAPAVAAATAAPEGDPKHPPAAKFDEAEFELNVAAPAAGFKAGQAGSIDVVLAAKAPYHVNDKYPIKLKLKETPGVKYENLVVSKDVVKLTRPAGKPDADATAATMPVSFTPEAGKRTLAGSFAFSVCTADKCLMEKRDISLDVAVE